MQCASLRQPLDGPREALRGTRGNDTVLLCVEDRWVLALPCSRFAPPSPPKPEPRPSAGTAGTISKTIVAPIERVKLVLQVQDVNKEQIPVDKR
jgi:solute carrier family 25 (mitochondrial adenine nucleotide translocator), member 4/5/6/31